MGALKAGIKAIGKFRLQGHITDTMGSIIVQDATFITSRIDLLDGKNREIGQLVMGGPKGDILHVDGVEVGIGQRNDVGKLRLWGRYDDGLQGGGVVSYNHMRRHEDVMEELAMDWGSALDNPVDHRGMKRVLIRTDSGQHHWQTVYVATTQFSEERFPQRVAWTGMMNFVGNMWKYFQPGLPEVRDFDDAVAALYLELLGRAHADGDVEFWRTYSGGDVEKTRQGIMGSVEYEARHPGGG